MSEAGWKTLVDDADAPESWILADRAGNKVCIASWPDGAMRPTGDDRLVRALHPGQSGKATLHQGCVAPSVVWSGSQPCVPKGWSCRYRVGDGDDCVRARGGRVVAGPADELAGPGHDPYVGGDAVLDRAERAEAMYRSLVDSLPGITYSESLDDAKTLSISPQVNELLGYTQEEWLGNPLLWVEVMHPDDRERVTTSCAEANESAASWRAEYRMIARDGRVVWVRDIATLVRSSDGQPLCWQGVMIDITALKGASS